LRSGSLSEVFRLHVHGLKPVPRNFNGLKAFSAPSFPQRFQLGVRTEAMGLERAGASARVAGTPLMEDGQTTGCRLTLGWRWALPGQSMVKLGAARGNLPRQASCPKSQYHVSEPIRIIELPRIVEKTPLAATTRRAMPS